ncbi:hypothetical protein BDN70DRAFT_916428 [Pholiota conissans]|uniref:F-box domain-containing protein n=1 Tax=Pholiota conissans TaxID=109636 RepID=A0A9P5ZDE8_9AGAR|nr:hypothetical protein BDN70DRAFT_916428 [Pholiota conissans]
MSLFEGIPNDEETTNKVIEWIYESDFLAGMSFSPSTAKFLWGFRLYPRLFVGLFKEAMLMHEFDKAEMERRLMAYAHELEGYEFPSETPKVDLVDFVFHDLDPEEFIAELWGPPQMRPRLNSKPRGNYIAFRIASRLRIEARKTKPRFKDLRGVLWLPNELISMIFENIHPMDLYNIIRSSKRLRAFLLGRHSRIIWKMSFIRSRDVPNPHCGISAPKWASLLFGPATCDNCYACNTMVDFTFRKRLCYTCLREETSKRCGEWIKHKVKEIMGEGFTKIGSVFDIVPRSSREDPFVYSDLRSPIHDGRFLKKVAIEKMKRMKILLRRIEKGVPDADEKYQKFRLARLRKCHMHMHACLRADAWASGYYNDSVDDFYHSVPSMVQMLKKLLLKRGHDSADIRTPLFELRGTFSRREGVWESMSIQTLAHRPLIKKLLPALEEEIAGERKRRLDAELEQRVKERKGAVNNFYLETVQVQIPMSVARYIPPVDCVCHIPAFSAYIDEDTSTPNMAFFSDTARTSEILDFVHRFGDFKPHLVQMMATAGVEWYTESLTAPDSVLALATAVFEYPVPCSHSYNVDGPLIGWEDVSRHVECVGHPKIGKDPSILATRYGTGPWFSKTGYKTVLMVLDLLRLDPRTTRACELDALNERFTCTACASSMKHVAVMDWRRALWHGIHARDMHEFCGGFRLYLISDELTTALRVHEKQYPPPTDKAWCCSHCTEHLCTPVTRAVAAAHVYKAHAIRPTAGLDFFYRPTMHPSFRDFQFVKTDEDSNHQCIRCPHPRNLRLWNKNKDLRKHLKDKHACQNPVDGVDYRTLKLGIPGPAIAMDTSESIP